ncbi:MAG: hypothetical protein GY953_24140, partial [bacterium]|nr:hypothetical protein [bacterium]
MNESPKSSTARLAKTTWHSLGGVGASLLRQKRLWVLGMGLTVGILAIGWWTQGVLERSLKEREAAVLTTILRADVSGLLYWIDAQKRTVSVMAELPSVQREAEALAALAASTRSREALTNSPARERLRRLLEPIREAYGFENFGLVDVSGLAIADSNPVFTGRRVHHQYSEALARVFSGETVLGLPQLDQQTESERESEKEELVLMFIAAPVRDAAGEIIACLSFSFHPEQDFTRMLF